MVSVAAQERERVEVVFDEPIDRMDLRDLDHFTVTVASDSTDTLGLLLAIGREDGRRVYLITAPQDSMDYEMRIFDLSDAAGNALTETSMVFAGSLTPDESPPAVLRYEPADRRMNVPQSSPIIITFDDRMNRSATGAAISIEPTVEGAIAWSRQSSIFHFFPSDTFPSDSMIRVRVGKDAADRGGNQLGREVEWSFITEVRLDTIPPRLKDVEPDSGAVQVPVSSDIVFTFNETMIATDRAVAAIYPDPDPDGDGRVRWDRSARVLTYDLGPAEDDTLDAGQTYSIYLPRFAFHDREGNVLRRDYQVVFATAESIDSGRCRLEGGVGGGGAEADVPRGEGWVVAYAGPEIVGARPAYMAPIAPETSAWQIDGVVCGTYYLIAVWDSDGDRQIDIEGGDAHGAYGTLEMLLPFRVPPEAGEPREVELLAHDPSAIVGNVIYVGERMERITVEAFQDTVWQGEPAARVGGLRTGERFVLDDLSVGTYIVRAYVDINADGIFDESEPHGVYGAPRLIDLAAGEDHKGVLIAIGDPPAG
ncbi:hypothetical protein AMJ39_01565 [candidate division TA06 bacterium DG_24]|uniref:SbsA Ig-like domain-containing protein n=4 Tax=Bacteria division TA06 TaxID=1156500 RepID=A0A0S7WW31_UNCT6|nr:MAG: hypothetical protein AMJ39_01565 [candidate division TA06 bacterium DG_24]